MKRKIEGMAMEVKPRKARQSKNSGNSRYLSVEERFEIRNKLLNPILTNNERKKARKELREHFQVTNSAITRMISGKYSTFQNDNMRIGAGMNPAMNKPRVHGDNHLILDQAVLEWIRKQKSDSLLRQLPLTRAIIIAEAVHLDQELKLGVFKDVAPTIHNADDDNDENDVNNDHQNEMSWIDDFNLDSDSDDSDYIEEDESSNEDDDDFSSDCSDIESIDIDIESAEDQLTNREHFTWYYNFLYRYRLKRKVAHGEASSCPTEEEIEERMTKVRNTLQNYPKANIYNMDEKGLFYTQLPKITHTILDEDDDSQNKGSKMMTGKERITLVVCCNVDGTHQIPPAVIGKAQKPRCFPCKRSGRSIPLPYWGQKKAWMDRSGMRKWLDEVFLPEVEEKDKVVLLIDNCTAHNEVASTDKVEVIFLPENTTPMYQPLDQGIIHTLDRR